MSLDTNQSANADKSNILGFFKRRPVLTGFLIFIIAVIGWWKYEFPSATWRYKMTVTVETPEGLKTGSAVREVTYKNGPKILPDVAGSNWKVDGEAVVVDLGHGKYLFAMMDVNGSYQIVYDVFPYAAKSVHDHIRYYKSLTGQKKTLEKSQYPTLVTFADIKDPKTVTQVDQNNLSATLGAGVTLKDITIEMTDETITRDVNDQLPWLKNIRANLDGSDVTTGSSYANTLHIGYFKRGE